ncbi:MAG: hypothetical protein GTO66_19455 [Candidatus Aminicenantes bacterium]|nr:hypothetical protein [Candidatus Aminicenantes bacterium]NIN44122.1 hypothetical protein [Candidatus Aminicenantes bacterium]
MIKGGHGLPPDFIKYSLMFSLPAGYTGIFMMVGLFTWHLFLLSFYDSSGPGRSLLHPASANIIIYIYWN